MGLIAKACNYFKSLGRHNVKTVNESGVKLSKIIEEKKCEANDKVCYIKDGYTVFEIETFRVIGYEPRRKHKRHRIQKKWLKRYGARAVTIPEIKVYQVGNTLIGHPVAIRKFFKKGEI